MTINEVCPNCSTPIETPHAFHGGEGETMHTHRECPTCGRPLIWFNDSEDLAFGWRIDEAEERRRARATR
jgi:endogenous inhibitor of DNA gyrase (YacG/DUF329 family)